MLKVFVPKAVTMPPRLFRLQPHWADVAILFPFCSRIEPIAIAVAVGRSRMVGAVVVVRRVCTWPAPTPHFWILLQTGTEQREVSSSIGIRRQRVSLCKQVDGNIIRVCCYEGGKADCRYWTAVPQRITAPWLFANAR